MFNFFNKQQLECFRIFLFGLRQTIFVYFYLVVIGIIFFQHLVVGYLSLTLKKVKLINKELQRWFTNLYYIWFYSIISLLLIRFYSHVLLYFVFNWSVLDWFLFIFLFLFFNFIYFCANLYLLPVYLLPELFLLVMILLILFYYCTLLLNFKNSLNNKLQVHLFEDSSIRTVIIPKPFNLQLINLSVLTLFFFIMLQLQLYFNLLKSHTILFFTVYSNFCIDPVILLIKFIISFISLVTLLVYLNLNSVFYKFEISISILLTVFSASLLLHSYALTTFFLSLELFNFCTLILVTSVSSNKQLRLNTIKYFLFNSLSSLLLLSFIVFTFGTFGTFSFKLISLICLSSFNDLAHFNIYISLIFALIFFIVGFLIKLGAFPFHMWLFELYEDLPYFCMAYLLSLTKLTTFTFGFYFSIIVFSNCSNLFRWAFMVFGLLTLISASFLSFIQISVRRFLIVNSIFSTGSLLIILSVPTLYGQASFFLYLLCDCIFFFTFTLFLNFLDKKRVSPKTNKLYGSTLSSLLDFSLINNFYLKVFIALLLFVYSGFPPFAFFYMKLYILNSLISNGFFFIACIFVSTSFIILFSFFRILKSMFFFANITNKRVKYSVVTLSESCSFTLLFIFIFIFLLALIFFFYSNFVFNILSSFVYFL